jgi:hypothetical protein
MRGTDMTATLQQMKEILREIVRLEDEQWSHSTQAESLKWEKAINAARAIVNEDDIEDYDESTHLS